MIEGLLLLFICFVVVPAVVCTIVFIYAFKRLGVRTMGILIGIYLGIFSILWSLPAPVDPFINSNLHVNSLFKWIVIRVYIHALDAIYYTLDILALTLKVLKGR